MDKSPRTYIKIFLITLFAITLTGYVLFQTRNLIIGPVITIDSPKSGASITDPLIEVVGTARNIAHISFNDRVIFVDEEGHFFERLLLSYGYNIITIAGQDKFGRKTEETIEIVYR